MPKMPTRQSTSKPCLVDNIFFLDQVFLHLTNVDTCSPRNRISPADVLTNCIVADDPWISSMVSANSLRDENSLMFFVLF